MFCLRSSVLAISLSLLTMLAISTSCNIFGSVALSILLLPWMLQRLMRVLSIVNLFSKCLQQPSYDKDAFLKLLLLLSWFFDTSSCSMQSFLDGCLVAYPASPPGAPHNAQTVCPIAIIRKARSLEERRLLKNDLHRKRRIRK